MANLIGIVYLHQVSPDMIRAVANCLIVPHDVAMPRQATKVNHR